MHRNSSHEVIGAVISLKLDIVSEVKARFVVFVFGEQRNMFRYEIPTSGNDIQHEAAI